MIAAKYAGGASSILMPVLCTGCANTALPESRGAGLYLL
jgi:hypothetical protein